MTTMITITEALHAEHLVLRAVFDEVERALPALEGLEGVRVLARVVENLLRAHGDAEDNLVYVALNHLLAEQGQFQRLHQEHEEIDARLETIPTAADAVAAARLLKGALRKARAHFLAEEQVVFPLLEQNLSLASRKELAQAWSQRHLAQQAV